MFPTQKRCRSCLWGALFFKILICMFHGGQKSSIVFLIPICAASPLTHFSAKDTINLIVQSSGCLVYHALFPQALCSPASHWLTRDTMTLCLHLSAFPLPQGLPRHPSLIYVVFPLSLSLTLHFSSLLALPFWTCSLVWLPYCKNVTGILRVKIKVEPLHHCLFWLNHVLSSRCPTCLTSSLTPVPALLAS